MKDKIQVKKLVGELLNISPDKDGFYFADKYATIDVGNVNVLIDKEVIDAKNRLLDQFELQSKELEKVTTRMNNALGEAVKLAQDGNLRANEYADKMIAEMTEGVALRKEYNAHLQKYTELLDQYNKVMKDHIKTLQELVDEKEKKK